MFGRRHLTFAAPLLLALSQAACVATATSAPSRGVVVNGPPPAPIEEARSAPPSATAAWVDGYWHWSGARYVWIPGHWENAPPGAQWYAPRYTQNADGRFYYEPGEWSSGAAPARTAAPISTANALH